MKKILKKLIVCTLILSWFTTSLPVYALTKEESAYVKLDSEGNIKNVVVSEHLYDFNDGKTNDKSNLLDIKSLNENQTFKQNGNNISWKTEGNDIYYQGTYDKDLPVSMSVKYYLNGEEKNIDGCQVAFWARHKGPIQLKVDINDIEVKISAKTTLEQAMSQYQQKYKTKSNLRQLRTR